MEISLYVNKYKQVRYDFFRWRHELDLVQKLALAASFACITGLLAQVRVYLPGNPVPLTGQTFAVLLGAVILGRWGGISQALYVGLGVAGVPWFAGLSSGFAYLAGPTGGYLIGFMLAAFFLGYMTDRYIRSRSFMSMFALMLFADFVLVYGCGLLQLYGWLSLAQGTSISIGGLLMMGLIPFIVGDVIKIAAAAAIANGITPKAAFNGEVDVEKSRSWRIP